MYAHDLAGNRTSEQIQNGGTLSVSGAAHNIGNQLTGTSGSASGRFKGTLDELGTVTVDGIAASFDSRTTNFTGFAPLSCGTNIVTIVASDYSANTRTNQYQVVVTNNAVAKTLTYDLNGNLASMVTATSTNTFTWDALDRLVVITQQASGSPTLTTEFSYNGRGERVRKVEKQDGVAVSTNQFLWAGGALPSEERDATGSTVIKRFFAHGQQVGGTNYFFVRDHLGSIRELTDASGTVRARYQYDPYGQRTKVSGNLDTEFGFTGHYYHEVSGLFLTLYRAYDPETGRWISRDPIAEDGGLNLYAYAFNDPVGLADPLGLDPSMNDLFWVNVYDNGASDAGRFLKRVGQHALDLARTAVRNIYDPVGAVRDVITGAQNFGTYMGTLSADPCARQNAWEGFKDHMTTPEGIADATIFIEGLLAGRALGGKGGACFPAGTVISTSDGEKPIETLEEGDLVWSQDEETGEMNLKRVKRLFTSIATVLVLVTAGTNTTEATPEHPFWVEPRGWTAVAELKAGDVLSTLSGKRVEITNVDYRQGRVQVYNFEVEGYHTYFVSEQRTLVHNSCAPKVRSPFPIGLRLRFSTMKAAREAAEHASPYGKAVRSKAYEGDPHFHPADANGRQLNHDHYYFPRRKR
jgi:RHS repeat-associated protein